MRRILPGSALLFLLLWLGGVAQAQQECRVWQSNPQNAGAALSISSTAVVVIAPNQAICSGYIANVGADDMRCRSTQQGDPTTTVGNLVAVGETLRLSGSAGGGVKCIATGNDTTADVAIERK